MVQRASSLSLRTKHQQATTERIGGSILDWVNDPDKNDISVEVFLTAKNSKNHREVLALTFKTCSDAFQKAARRRYRRIGQRFLKAVPNALLVTLPYLVADVLTGGWTFPDRIFPRRRY